MPLRVACQMDPIERIDIRGDSTFAILLEAQNAGMSCSTTRPPTSRSTATACSRAGRR